ncbi:phage virion morphogenesis protein [Lysobacter brunescens]|uniref:Phage virion morphogenesis protein n=1 Tax=Lysobacter brunescens TaxID=262323 RepID=A0ABW2YFP3_9GAMM
MSDDLTALETWAEPLLARLSPGERRALSMTMGREIRRSQHARVQAQLDADGRQFVPRKALRDQAGRIRRQRDGKLFRQLTKADYLRVQATPDGVAVGFFGRVARIALVHQEGLVDQVKPGGPSVRYERRKLLGFTPEDRERMRDLLLQHLSAR